MGCKRPPVQIRAPRLLLWETLRIVWFAFLNLNLSRHQRLFCYPTAAIWNLNKTLFTLHKIVKGLHFFVKALLQKLANLRALLQTGDHHEVVIVAVPDEVIGRA